MYFIGIFSTKKEYEFIKKEIEKSSNKNINIIHINNKSIENLCNIKFDAVILDKKTDTIEIDIIQKILKDIKYLIINSDIKIKNGILSNIETNIIDYGLNQKSTVTASSISEENIIICLQRNIKNTNEKIIETNEKKEEKVQNIKSKKEIPKNVNKKIETKPVDKVPEKNTIDTKMKKSILNSYVRVGSYIKFLN